MAALPQLLPLPGHLDSLGGADSHLPRAPLHHKVTWGSFLDGLMKGLNSLKVKGWARSWEGIALKLLCCYPCRFPVPFQPTRDPLKTSRTPVPSGCALPCGHPGHLVLIPATEWTEQPVQGCALTCGAGSEPGSNPAADPGSQQRAHKNTGRCLSAYLTLFMVHDYGFLSENHTSM